MLKDKVKQAQLIGGMEIHKKLLTQIEEVAKEHSWEGQYISDVAYFIRDSEAIQTERDNWQLIHEALKELIEALEIITDKHQ